MDKDKKLLRSTKNRWIAGVCGGLADFFDLNADLVRLIYVVLTFGTAFCGVIVYIILAIVVPKDNNE
ncbi:PspC family transcriptional regulator [Hallella multisaccharivorax DSM 17128]|uniref:Phage shock protein C, PspC n=1 Tax=Hallella multisaccharivorax DSM 17128 TaxID=688246 RepID=F8NCT9_9BACT|nr:PspC domain-containing protein [Hallella multisaccharivorax]EGN58124.1 phage shock protein C, PspC [Hallella multisaccharivorax DSM 17128]GJG31779.1 PspC family transcriptional regulator [Hallella multisaccharivorax DSM 17128]